MKRLLLAFALLLSATSAHALVNHGCASIVTVVTGSGTNSAVSDCVASPTATYSANGITTSAAASSLGFSNGDSFNFTFTTSWSQVGSASTSLPDVQFYTFAEHRLFTDRPYTVTFNVANLASYSDFFLDSGSVVDGLYTGTLNAGLLYSFQVRGLSGTSASSLQSGSRSATFVLTAVPGGVVVPVPEPMSLALLGGGVALFGLLRRRRNEHRAWRHLG